MKSVLTIAAMLGLAVAFAGDEDWGTERRKWRVSVGGAFNGAVKASLSPRNLPLPASSFSGVGKSTMTEAQEAAASGDFGAMGQIHDDDQPSPYRLTSNWKIHKDAKTGVDAEGTSQFSLRNDFEEVLPGNVFFGGAAINSSDDTCQFGVSAEISRELWMHAARDENDHAYGLDFAAAFSYFFQRNLYSYSGVRTRTDLSSRGYYETTVADANATWDYDHEGASLHQGVWYGEATPVRSGAPVLDQNRVVTSPNPTMLEPGVYNSSYAYTACGDYRELEMLFMLRPWYDLTEWWRLYCQLGVAVSWGCLESDYSAGYGAAVHERFDNWNVYGAGGIGTMFRYGRYCLSIDGLMRFLRDDMDVSGRSVGGTIERSWWGVRAMVGVEF